MIQITTKDNEFSYDLKALVMAFFPEMECTVLKEEAWQARDGFTVRIRMEGGRAEETFFPSPYTKDEVKRWAYRFLKECSGRELPWGILTGVRPAKLPMRMFMHGLDEDRIRNRLREEYLLSDRKAALALDVARREYELTKGIDHEGSVNLYIGIPFCPSICGYCSFSAYPISRYEARVDDYLDALEKELCYAGEAVQGRTLRTVYIGGGTPTSLGEEAFARLLAMTDSYLPMAGVDEYTVEAGRPDSITEEKLRRMREHGVSRISVNPQSMKQHTLELLGRKHTVEDVRRVFGMARELGFDNINMDVIAGLPEETPEDMERTLEELHLLDPDSITVHTLVIKRASRMRRERLESGEGIAGENIWIPDMQDYAESFCRGHGLLPYYMYRQKNKALTTRNTNQENVAYAKPGKECLYNIFMMEELETILALGSGGSTKYVIPEENRMERVENVKSVEDYINRIDEMIERKIAGADAAGMVPGSCVRRRR